jgi:hypothetical protein
MDYFLDSVLTHKELNSKEIHLILYLASKQIEKGFVRQEDTARDLRRSRKTIERQISELRKKSLLSSERIGQREWVYSFDNICPIEYLHKNVDSDGRLLLDIHKLPLIESNSSDNIDFTLRLDCPMNTTRLDVLSDMRRLNMDLGELFTGKTVLTPHSLTPHSLCISSLFFNSSRRKENIQNEGSGFEGSEKQEKGIPMIKKKKPVAFNFKVKVPPSPKQKEARTKAKAIENYNVLDLENVFSRIWRDTFTHMHPATWKMKERSVASRLLRDQGAAKLIEAFEYILPNWDRLAKRYKIKGGPSISVISVFFSSLMYEMEIDSKKTSSTGKFKGDPFYRRSPTIKTEMSDDMKRRFGKK